MATWDIRSKIVQPWDMVDNSASPLQTTFGTYQQPVFAASRKILIYLVSDYLKLNAVSSLL